MSVESSISDTTEAIVAALARHELTDEERKEIEKHVSRLLLKTVEKTTENHLATTANCCGPELDLAHQIRAEINRQKEILINNLKALR
jgi:dsRNA-specific ribonuclease